MAPKPRKVDDASLFTNDWREGVSKKWWLSPVIQPVVIVRQNGLLEDPDALARPVLAMFEADAIVGNVPEPMPGVPAEVWEIRSISLISAAGGNYSFQDDGVVVAPFVAVGVGAVGELVNVGVPVAGASVILINGGLAADAWNMRAVRLL